MNFGQHVFVDYSTPRCMAVNTGSLIGRCNRVCNNASISDQDIVDIKNYFNDIHFTWAVNATDTQTIGRLVAHSLHHKATSPGMILELLNLKVFDAHQLITIKQVACEQEFNDWVEITGTNYGYNKIELARAINFLRDRAGQYLKLYLASYDGKAVASSMIAYHDNSIVSMHLVGTLSEYRKKGIGNAILSRPLLIAREHGYEKAVLMSSTMGLPLAQKLGFKEFITYEIYGNY